MEWILSKDFYIPLFSTLGASFAVIFLGFMNRRITETKQKIYAINYISDVCLKITTSELILLRHTIRPHIVATRRIIEGDEDLLAKKFVSDEFDILTAGTPEYSHLPNEYKLLIGYDDITLVQIFDALMYLHKTESTRLSLNSFVTANLKSMHGFLMLTQEKKLDVLYTYNDYLERLEHESNRLISFVSDTVVPTLESYLSSYRFWLYSRKSAGDQISKLKTVLHDNSDIVPDRNYMEKVRNGGIQSAL